MPLASRDMDLADGVLAEQFFCIHYVIYIYGSFSGKTIRRLILTEQHRSH